MKQAGGAKAVVELLRVVVGIGQIVGPPAIIGDPDEQGDDPGAARNADLARMAGARCERQLIVAALAGAVRGDRDDIIAVLGEHRVDPAVGRGLAVDVRVVADVLGTVGTAQLKHRVQLVRGQRDRDSLAALGMEAEAIGESPGSLAPVPLREAAVDGAPDRDRLRDDRRGDPHVGRGCARLQAIGPGLAGPERGRGDPVGPVGGELDDEPAVQRIAALGIVIGEVEPLRPGHHEVGIECIRGEIDLEPLSPVALDQIDVFIFSRAPLRVVGAELAGDRLARPEARSGRRGLPEGGRRPRQRRQPKQECKANPVHRPLRMGV